MLRRISLAGLGTDRRQQIGGRSGPAPPAAPPGRLTLVISSWLSFASCSRRIASTMDNRLSAADPSMH